MADPELHREVRAVAAKLAIRAAGAGDSSVRHALQPLVLVFGVGEAARAPAFWQAYTVLSGLPVEALREGIEDYLKAPDSEFFPKPGPLKALCDKHAAPIFKAAFRAAKAAGTAPTKSRTVSEEEKAAVHRMATQAAKSLAMASVAAWPKRTAPEDIPSIAGDVDEGGITAEMRELIARRMEDATRP